MSWFARKTLYERIQVEFTPRSAKTWQPDLIFPIMKIINEQWKNWLIPKKIARHRRLSVIKQMVPCVPTFKFSVFQY